VNRMKSILEKDKSIVLVEPMAWSQGGHYQDKLLIWRAELMRLGYKVIIITLKNRLPQSVKSEEIITLHPLVLSLYQKLPRGIAQFFMFTCAYAKGIRIARRKGVPLLGLTTRAALPVWLASIVAGKPKDGWGFHLMNCYLNGMVGKLQRLAFARLVKKSCYIFSNLPENLTKIGLEDKLENACYLPDPIFLGDQINFREKNEGLKLLLAGKDNDRRNAVRALNLCKFPAEISSVHFHMAIDDESELANFKKNNPAVNVKITNHYCSSEEFYQLFTTADLCLISYHPSFPAGSGNLVNALVAGTHVISSKISHATYLSEQYPGMIEFFEYENTESLESALSEACNIDSEELEKFRSSVINLREQVSVSQVVKQCLSKLVR
jgi:glycosyltransferase involved in cell wall biosynthesis